MASSSGFVNGYELSLESRQIYYKLRSIFPNINPQYITEVLVNTPAGVRENAGSEQLTNDLVEHLITYGDAHVDFSLIGRSQNGYLEQVSSTPEIQHDRLIGIFPDADPDFLRDIARNFFQNPQRINSFIEENLEEKNYPTREQYVARKKLAEKYRKYFTDFDVKKFLAEFPDPFTYFEGEQRKCVEDKTVYNLLCDQFQNLEANLISSDYRNSNFNPSLSFKKLLERKGVAKRAFSSEQFKKLDTYMPEFAFLFNRDNVKQYLEKMQKEEEEALQKSKILHCETCFHDFIPEKCSTCANGHIFCNDCILSGTKCSIAQAKYSIKCFKDCVSFFNLKTLEKVLNPELFNILVKKQQEEELANANIGNLESCPFCDYKSVVNEGDKIFTCMHEDCKKESCRRCKKGNHLPYECADVFESKNARLYLEEKMTKALVRTCYSCQKEFIKEEGCNRMNCVCGAVMCYLCDKAVPANNYTHFNGQGSDRHDLCPLYSDDARQEAEGVIEVAKRTTRELQKKIPDLNLDVDKLLPILPPKTSGPHEQVPNSNQIPEHALRVAKAIPP